MSRKKEILTFHYEKELRKLIFNNDEGTSVYHLNYMFNPDDDMPHQTALCIDDSVFGVVKHDRKYGPDVYETVSAIEYAVENKLQGWRTLRGILQDINNVKYTYDKRINTPLFRWIAEDLFQISGTAFSNNDWGFENSPTIRASEIVFIGVEGEEVRMCIGAGTTAFIKKEYYDDLIEFLATKFANK